MGDKESLSRPGLICLGHILWHYPNNPEEFNKRSFQECSLWMHKGLSQVGQQLAWSFPGEKSHLSIRTSAFPVCPALLLYVHSQGWLTWTKAAGISLSSGKQLVSERSCTWRTCVDVWHRPPTPLQLWHSVIYEEVPSPHPSLAGTPLSMTSSTSCLGALMLKVQHNGTGFQQLVALPAVCYTTSLGVLWGFRTGQRQMLRDLCMEAEWGGSLLPGQCVLSGARNSPHPEYQGPIQKVPEDSPCLSTIWSLLITVPVAKLAFRINYQEECCIKETSTNFPTSLTDSRRFGATGQSCYSWQ